MTWSLCKMSRSGVLRATDAASTKAAFVEFYGAAAGDTKNLIADLRRAGTPNVASGTKIAKKLVAGASAARVVFKRAVASAKNLPTSDKAAFLLAVGKLQQQLQRATDPILAALQAGGSVSSAALDRAFAGQPQCQVFVGHQPGP